MDEARAIELALERARAVHAPDSRTAVFDVEGRRSEDGVALSGVVQHAALKRAAADAIERRVAAPVSTDGIDTLDTRAGERTVAAPVVPVRAGPGGDAKQVTQALYGARVTGFDAAGGWRRVRTPDGYVAWIDRADLVAPVDVEPDAMVTAPRVDRDGTAVHAGTECAVVEEGDESIGVRFRTGETATLSAGDVAHGETATTGDAVVDTARRFRGAPYEWGGMTIEGIDCSGLSWMAYHLAGVALPRDSDQQRRMGREIDRDDLRAGDLLFFPGHVAVSAGGDDVVHASGSAGAVVEASLDPASDAYDEFLGESFETARRYR